MENSLWKTVRSSTWVACPLLLKLYFLRPYWLLLLFPNWPSLHSLLLLYWNWPSLYSLLSLHWLSLTNSIVLLADLWSLSSPDSLIDFTTLLRLGWVLSVSAMILASFFETTSVSNTTLSSLLSCTFLISACYVLWLSWSYFTRPYTSILQISSVVYNFTFFITIAWHFLITTKFTFFSLITTVCLKIFLGDAVSFLVVVYWSLWGKLRHDMILFL